MINPIFNLKEGWKLNFQDKTIAAAVPGDITLDIYNAGLIENPYFGINHRGQRWITESDFVYENIFDVSADILGSDEVLLEFDGIDTFADIYLNGKHLGYTDNMFYKFTYSVKDILKQKGNELKVKMYSVFKKMDEIDDRGFFGVFNVKRLFIRKAQCHFGWDWAPDMPGYGIWGDVRIKGVNKFRIEDTRYKAYNDGTLTIFTHLNFYPTRQKSGAIEGKLRYTVSLTPDKDGEVKILETPLDYKNNFINLKIDNPELWWPSGLGAQPLYNYKVELIVGDKVVDEITCRYAFRTVELIEAPQGERSMGYKIRINGRETFIKGSNWVPIECFTGAVRDEKYENVIQKAVDANMNMLRVWGGGIYEKDIFYDLCDEKGIMVWQDLAFACSDIPDDDEKFTQNVRREVEYQVKRLRNHPSLVYWCGGNEKTGTYGLGIIHGDYFVDVILRGLVLNLDDTRPFSRQSPCSLTDVGNDKTSGESHAGSFELALEKGIENYAELVSKTDVSFISENAIMGPTTVESLRKIFPENKLWPINEYWDDRLMDNPYAAIRMSFAKREEYYADTLYGKSDNVEQFVAKAMTVHAEAIRTELEFARANKATCGGYMNWMYSEIWPSSTWAIIDYFCEPKQAYYQMKRSNAPILFTFVLRADGKTHLVIINDTTKKVFGNLTYGVKSLDGEVLCAYPLAFSVEDNGIFDIETPLTADRENSYFFIDADAAEQKFTRAYSQKMWRDCSFKKGGYTYTVEKEEGGLKVTISATTFVKGLTLSIPDNYKYAYTDNYFDLEAGEQKTVLISGASDEKSLKVTDFSEFLNK